MEGAWFNTSYQDVNMKSYLIDKYCHIIETDCMFMSAYGYEDRFSLQVNDGVIEAVNSYHLFRFKGKTAVDVENFILAKEKQYIESLEENKKYLADKSKRDELLYEEETKKYKSYLESKYEGTTDRELALW